MLKIIAVLSVIILTGGCQFGPSNSMPNSTKNQSSLDGVWASEGYGYILQVTGKKKKLFDISNSHCFDKGFSSKELSATLTDIKQVNKQTIQAKIQSGITDYYFKRIEKLPDTCKQVPVKNHAESIRYFIEIMKEHYAYFDLYGVDWDKRSKQVLPLLKNELSDTDAYEIMTSLLSGINDAHTSFIAEVNGEIKRYSTGRSKTLRPALDQAFSAQNEIQSGSTFRRAWFEAHKNNIEQTILKGQYQYAANDRIIWGVIGEVGYINLLRMINFTESATIQDDLSVFKAEMNKIMKVLKNTQSLIVDVTTNSGGHDEIGLAMAGFFTQSKTPVYSKFAHGSGLSPQSVVVEPNGVFYDKPVYLLSSDHTVSAAETFVLAMRSLPQVTHVGDYTRGAFSDILEKTLPNGWEVGFSNETYLDTSGVSWEGQGITPQWHTPVFAGEDIFQSHGRTVLGLLQKIVR